MKGRKTQKRKPSPLERPSAITWTSARCEATAAGWHCVIPVPVSGNRIWRSGRGRTYEAKQHRTDKSECQRRFGKAGKLTGDVAIRVVWVRAARRGDIDNFGVKPVLDILKGVFFEDDAQVAELQVIRQDDPTLAAGMYCWIWPYDEPKREAA